MFDLCHAAECAAEQVAPVFALRLQRLALDLTRTPAVVDCDATRLAQAIVNLLRNASQFSAAGSLVSLTLECDGGSARLRVQDRGEGVALGLLPKFFDPFVQAEQALERPAGGLGLGLSLVKGILELHGGSATAESAGPGTGSALTLTLPLARLPVAAQPAVTGLAVASLTARGVLVVDDNPDVAQACALMLRILGQRVHIAADGPAAL
jgi:signal transduction histidine kinase